MDWASLSEHSIISNANLNAHRHNKRLIAASLQLFTTFCLRNRVLLQLGLALCSEHITPNVASR
jgi:hypothetical protein